MKKILAILVILSVPIELLAGYDVTGYITSVHLKAGVLQFSFSNSNANTYCKPGWGGMNFYVPRDHEDFPYYYGLISSANASKQFVRLANISVFDGTTACDITKTGYGIHVYQGE
ncbi:hypothetical protein SAMN02745866_03674 [Alteromonadaceae bacterium Bs31]|nr:hypothetical protein SAMN02745866_03674 [Alteromonadaceae bacterium Bs31]